MIFTAMQPSKNALSEARAMKIPSIGIVDTDCDPDKVIYAVPGNDDSPAAMRLYYKLFKAAVLDGKKRRAHDLPASVPFRDEQPFVVDASRLPATHLTEAERKEETDRYGPNWPPRFQ
eukprot:Opistho-2@76010